MNFSFGCQMFKRTVKTVLSRNVKGHFGQWGEDILVRKLFSKNKKNGIYLDIGAYHPFKHSNTAYLWMKGWNGINIDANRNSISIFNKIRPYDINIWSAVIPSSEIKGGAYSFNVTYFKR